MSAMFRKAVARVGYAIVYRNRQGYKGPDSFLRICPGRPPGKNADLEDATVFSDRGAAQRALAEDRYRAAPDSSKDDGRVVEVREEVVRRVVESAAAPAAGG